MVRGGAGEGQGGGDGMGHGYRDGRRGWSIGSRIAVYFFAMRRLALVVLTAATAVVCLTVGAAAAAPLPVVVSGANDIKADRAGSDLIFSQSRHGKPSSYDAFLKRGSAARIKLNLLGNGYAGGINNGRIVYQQVASGDSGLRVYSIGAGTRSTPRVLNSLAWDFAPAIQGNLVLFGRRNFSLRPETDKILLADLGT